ncbi:MAG: CotH kinase family protein [Melioribacteraceae bacterium]|nr:CotH kinase family protein [Melioribacteraceae bacterium]
MGPDSLLLVFASGKDINETVQHWETIIREGDNCKYLVPQSNLSNEWKLSNYNDANWSTGQTGIGYGDNDDNTTISKTTSAYLRCKFNIADVNQISGLFLNIDFDDGFVAYLNGQEIARQNFGAIGSAVFYNILANSNHEAQLYQGYLPNSYPISNNISLLQNGENVLSIEVHNVSSTSSDLTLIPFLSIGYNSIPSNSRGSLDFLNLKETQLHTNFKLNASGDFLILSNANGEIEDSLYTREQISDVSLGRFPNGSENLYFFDLPTPGKNNIDNGFTHFLKPPTFSVGKGFYDTPFFLDIINPNSSGNIRYTLDGSDPNLLSAVYTNQLVVSEISVIRAKIFADGSLPSKSVTNTYFVNQEQRLPIVSLTTNPEHFFDSDSGIYVLGPNAESADPHYGANYWQDWERPIHMEFFEENNEFGFEIDLGVKIFGQWSRANAQKSLALYARGDYGYSEIDYPLFPNSKINKYQSFVLRNSGNDWAGTMLRDPLAGEIVSSLDIDRQMYRPVVVYLNGEYWGIHNLREKVNEHFIESHHGISGDDINIIENNFQLVHGEKASYDEFYNSLNNLDMTTESAFEYINSKIDVNEFIDYYLTEIFIDNQDWPGNNIKFWQQRSTNSKWRWILYDTDFGFGIWNSYAYNQNTLAFALETNGPDWPNPPWSTFLLRQFLKNKEFKNIFISRYSTYSNTIFSSGSINKVIDNFTSKIRYEMPEHLARWGGNYSQWVSEISRLRAFATNRSTYLNAYFASGFGITGQYQLSISQNIEQGTVEITDFNIIENDFSGNFFDNIPLKIHATPTPEFSFSHWEGGVNSTENPIILTTSNNVTLSPVFIPVSDTQIVINEINYNSNELSDPDDWIELYNYSDESINLSGWVFKDEDPEPYFIIPENTIIASDEYLILCRDTVLFKLIFPNVTNFYGNFGFGLSGGGELVRLYNSAGYLVDSLTYEDKEPWPTITDGGGPTLELRNPNVDNSKYYYWNASEGYGTPGELNSVYSSVQDEKNFLPKDYILLQNYPNPFNPTTSISYSIPIEGNVELKVFNMLGQEIFTLVNSFQKTGIYSIKINGNNLPSGLYIYRLQSGNFVKSRKMILLK